MIKFILFITAVVSSGLTEVSEYSKYHRTKFNSNENFSSFNGNNSFTVAFGEFGARQMTAGFENDARVEAFAMSFQKIDCYSEHMVVYLERDFLTEAEITTNYQFSFKWNDENSESCFASSKSNSSHFVLVSLYTKCGTVKMTNLQSISFKNQVLLVFHPHNSNDEPYNYHMENHNNDELTIIQDVYCTFYNKTSLPDFTPLLNGKDGTSKEKFSEISSSQNNEDSTSSVKYTFRLQLYDGAWIGSPWIKYPKVVYDKQTIYAQLQFSQAITDNDLRPLVKECYFTQTSKPASQPRYNVIRASCPVVNSAIIHSRSDQNNKISRFTFEASQYFDNVYMFFHCKLTVCSQSGEREVEGIEKCPSSTACSDQVDQLADYELANSVQHYVSSGPIRVLVSSESSISRRGNVQFDLSAPLSTTCPPCPVPDNYLQLETQKPNSDAQSQKQVIIASGMSISAVVGIASVSFAIGVALMGGLWKVHYLTEPNKLLSKHLNRKSDRDFISVDTSYSMEPTVSTPMTESSSIVLGKCSPKSSSLK